MEAISHVRLLIPPPEKGAPVAIGGTPSGDASVLPSLMAAAVLADAGYAEVNLGPNLPAGALRLAIGAHEPDLVWISLTSHLSVKDIERHLKDLLSGSEDRKWQLVVGGRKVSQLAQEWSKNAVLLDSLTELEEFVADRG